MKLFNWIKAHKFEAYLASFLLMVLPVLPLYMAVQRGATGWIAGLLLTVILGNLFAIAID